MNEVPRHVREKAAAMGHAKPPRGYLPDPLQIVNGSWAFVAVGPDSIHRPPIPITEPTGATARLDGKRLTAAATDATPDEPARLVRLTELTPTMARDYPDPPHDILPGLPLQEFGLLAAEPKAGKSFLAALMALAVATGKDIGNGIRPEYPDGKRVLFATMEENRARLLRRLAAMIEHYGLNESPYSDRLRNFQFAARGDTRWLPVSLDQVDPAAEAIYAAIHASRAKLAILDPLAQFQVEESNEVLHAFGGRLGELSEALGCCTVVVHHLRKQSTSTPNEEITLDSIRGGSALTAAARFVLALRRGEDGQRTLINLAASHGPDTQENHWQIESRLMRNGAVGVPVKWTPTGPTEGLDENAVRAALASACELPPERRRIGIQAHSNWIGVPIGLALDLDTGSGRAKNKTPAQRASAARVLRLLEIWETQELLGREMARRSKGQEIEVYCAGPRLQTTPKPPIPQVAQVDENNNM